MNNLIVFSSKTCTPCKMVYNYLKEKGVLYQSYDVEDNVENSFKYGISGIPTLLLVESDGTVVDRFVGYKPPEIDKLISQL